MSCMPDASRNFCWQVLLWLRLFKTLLPVCVYVCVCAHLYLIFCFNFFSNGAYFPSGWQDTVYPRSLPHSLMSPAPQSHSCWTVLPQMLRWVVSSPRNFVIDTICLCITSFRPVFPNTGKFQEVKETTAPRLWSTDFEQVLRVSVRVVMGGTKQAAAEEHLNIDQLPCLEGQI